MYELGLEIFKCLLSDNFFNLFIFLGNFREFTVLITLLPILHSLSIAQN